MQDLAWATAAELAAAIRAAQGLQRADVTAAVADLSAPQVVRDVFFAGLTPAASS